MGLRELVLLAALQTLTPRADAAVSRHQDTSL
jgi:hypothetical protein